MNATDPIILNVPTDRAVDILSQEIASGLPMGMAIAVIVIIAAVVVWWQN